MADPRPGPGVALRSPDPALLSTLGEALAALGVRSFEAASPAEAEGADLVVLDLEPAGSADFCEDYDGEGPPLVLVLPAREADFSPCRGRRIDGFLRRGASPSEAGAVLAAALRLAEEARRLRDESCRLTALARASPDLLLVIDEEGTYLEIFCADEGLLLAKPERMRGRKIRELFQPELAEPLMSLIARATRGEMGGMIEYRLEVLGGPRWFEGRAAPAGIGPDGRRIAVFEARDVTDRKEGEAALKRALDEKGMILRELQHRVKNNLAMISSLVSLETDRLSSEEDREALGRVQDRIRAMALIYDMLYRSEDVLDVDLSHYLGRLLEALDEGYLGGPGGGRGLVELAADLAPVRLDLKRAVPLGIVVTELVTNAIKYAFPGGRRGRISVSLGTGEGAARLRIEDDGVGLAPSVDGAGTGLKLVELLVEQIGGSLSSGAGPGGGGLCHELALPLDPTCA